MVEHKVQAAPVARHCPLAVGRNRQALNPVVVFGHPRDLLFLHCQQEDAHRRFVLLVIYHPGGIFLFLDVALVQRRVFLCDKDDGVLVFPFEAPDAAFKPGQVPGFAALGVDEPELRPRCVSLLLRQRSRAQEGNQPPVGRPARTAVAVGPACQLDFLLFGQAAQEQIGNPPALVFVHPCLHPHRPLAVG